MQREAESVHSVPFLFSFFILLFSMYTKILTNLGLITLNAMQQATLKAWHQGNDIALLSPTGTGKTLAYLLPLVTTLAANSSGPSALVIVPGRELAQQSEDFMRRMKTSLRSFAATGGHSTMEEHRKMRDLHPDVIFATPGRLLDHLSKGNIDGSAVRYVIMDEYDKCAELGFQKDILEIFSLLPSHIRRIITSATDSENIPKYLNASFRTLDFRQDTPAHLPANRTNIYAVFSPRKDKLETLGRLLSHIGSCQTIVFVSHRESVERITNYLKKERFPAEGYHGGMEQERRERALYKFRCGATQILVATDLAARGLDIPEIHAVIEYHLPESETIHIHRAGRTARWEATGDIYLIKNESEHIPAFISAYKSIDVEKVPLCPTSPSMTMLYIGRGKRDKLSKTDIVGFLCKIGRLKAHDIGRIEIYSDHAFVSIRNSRQKELLTRIAGEKIKGLKTLIEPMRG